MKRKNPIPDLLRVGVWKPGVHGGPFLHYGWYRNGIPQETLIGTRFRQELEEGEFFFYLNVLYRPDREDLRNRLEYVICVDGGDPAALRAMWEYDGWDRE